MIRDKKPPISINDVGRDSKPEPERGPLTYMGNGKETPRESGEGGTKPKSKINYTQLLIAVAMSVLLALVVGNFMYSSKGDSLTLLDNQRLLEGQIEGVSGSVGQVQSRVNTESGRVDTLTANQANLASKSDLNSLSSLVGTFDSSIAGVKSTVDGLNPKVTSLEGKVVGLDTRVGTLEERLNNTNGGDGTGGADVLEYYLTGANQLYVRAAKQGVYIARITLVYPTPWMVDGANLNAATQEFHSKVGDSRDFVGTLRYRGESWDVVSISFYTGSFNLAVGQERTFNVPFSGPPNGYTTYVEVLPGVVSTVADDDTSI